MASRLPQARQKQPVKQAPFLHHHYDGWTITVLAIGCLLPAIIIFGTLFGIEKNIESFYFVQDIAAGIACVLGLLGILLYTVLYAIGLCLMHSHCMVMVKRPMYAC